MEYNANAVMQLRGTGLTSGEQYVVHLNDTRTQHYSGPATVEQATDTNHSIIRYHAQGSSVPDFTQQVKSHTTFNANGVPTTVLFLEKTECRV